MLIKNIESANKKKNDLKKSISHTEDCSKDRTINPPQLKQKPPNKSKI